MKSFTRWSNYCAGFLLISVAFFVVVYALDRGFGNAATRPLLWIFAITGIASSIAWIGFAFQAIKD